MGGNEGGWEAPHAAPWRLRRLRARACAIAVLCGGYLELVGLLFEAAPPPATPRVIVAEGAWQVRVLDARAQRDEHGGGVDVVRDGAYGRRALRRSVRRLRHARVVEPHVPLRRLRRQRLLAHHGQLHRVHLVLRPRKPGPLVRRAEER
eukprot:4036010-Pleurochrysis_carterae.AAC.1